MKRIIFSALTVSILLFSCSEHKESETTTTESIVAVEEETQEEVETSELAFDGVQAGDYTLFGHEEVSDEGAVSQDEMFDAFATNGEFNGKVNVTINEVCQKAGCWINFKKNEDENVMVFFRDHFTIPIEESAGKEAILYGSLVTDTLSVDFQKHLLDDAAEAGEVVSQEDYDAITEEKIDMSFDCVSILIK